MKQTDGDRLAEIKRALTPEHIREWASEGNVRLTAIERVESFHGATYVILARDGSRTQIHRKADYECARFTDTTPAAQAVAACEVAVRALGKRIEACLSGHPIGRDGLRGDIIAGKGFSAPDRPIDQCALYSIGPAPQLLGLDGIFCIRVRPTSDGNRRVLLTGQEARAQGETLETLQAKYGDKVYQGNSDAFFLYETPATYEIRFGYYAECGPKAGA